MPTHPRHASLGIKVASQLSAADMAAAIAQVCGSAPAPRAHKPSAVAATGASPANLKKRDPATKPQSDTSIRPAGGRAFQFSFDVSWPSLLDKRLDGRDRCLEGGDIAIDHG
jgi:hypothetical protein